MSSAERKIDGVVFQSDRRFFVVSYDASHGLLLFRSPKTNSESTRIDILFQDVRAIEMRCWFESVRIQERSTEYLDNFRSKPAEMVEPGNRIYSLHSRGWDGFVVGGIVAFHEDGGERMAPSVLLAGTHVNV